MYHPQQNKYYPQRFLLAHFVAIYTPYTVAIYSLLVHIDISQICFCGQISLQSATVNYRFSGNLTPLVETFILLTMAPFSSMIIKIIIQFILSPMFSRVLNKEHKGSLLSFYEMIASSCL